MIDVCPYWEWPAVRGCQGPAESLEGGVRWEIRGWIHRNPISATAEGVLPPFLLLLEHGAASPCAANSSVEILCERFGLVGTKPPIFREIWSDFTWSIARVPHDDPAIFREIPSVISSSRSSAGLKRAGRRN